ncbi:kinase-like domain-containing protein [Rhizophagus clarus]|uniref:Kinase-like domain-containing protein n=1 Tax=Rhizophagus clarus TaxID=94130 RepID=A0A8H3MI00_9GLOM|nr:kinase-like domain-containing protein [Rhizophagus clarus]
MKLEFLTKNFANWTSGNEIIDNFIQEWQSEYNGYGKVFEWVPYDKFIEIKEKRKSIAAAIWKEGPLSYNKNDEEWIRLSYEKVTLRYLYDSGNITDEFINKVKSHLLDRENYYGISQKPDTKDYILEWMRKSYRKVVLKYLSNLQNITDEFLNETTVIYDSYGISQNPSTKEYILVVHHKYSKKYCAKCDKDYIKPDHNCITDEFINKVESLLTNEIYYGVSQNPDTKVYILVFENDYFNKHCEKCGNKRENRYVWCKCYAEYLKDDFTNWTSGNEKLDSLIQKYQSKYDGDGEIFEWIPYDKFIDVKEVRKDDFAIASWTDGPLHYSKSNRKFERKLNKKVLLRYLNSSRNVNDDFLNKITYLMKNSYGISQNPNTKDYILVYKIGDYCENCGKKYNEFENHSKNCMSCRANQENEKINDLIQEMKLNIDYNANHILHNYIIFEWVPYDQFDDIKKIGQGGFSTVYSAIWKDGFLYFQGYTSTRIQDTRVALKCLHNSQNCLDEFISEVKAYSNQTIRNILKIYGMSQDPITKDYIMCWDSNPENRPLTINVKEEIELLYNSLDQKFKNKEKQHYEIEEQFKETQESRKENLLSIKNNNPSTHTHAVYTSRLLNPFTRNLSSNSTVEITDFTNNSTVEITDFTNFSE